MEIRDFKRAWNSCLKQVRALPSSSGRTLQQTELPEKKAQLPPRAIHASRESRIPELQYSSWPTLSTRL